MRERALSFRLATPTDIDALARLRWQLKAEDGDLDESDFVAFAKIFSTDVEARMCDGSLVNWVVADHSNIIGAMTIVIVNKVPSPGKPDPRWGYLTNCYLSPDARQHGTGTLLLNSVKKWAREQGLELLIVWPSDRAFRFYERAGFNRPNEPLVIEFD